MNKFHQAVAKYRECTRHIRNTYFQPVDGSPDIDFADAHEGWWNVNYQLYFALVIYPHNLQPVEPGLPNPSITPRLIVPANVFINRDTTTNSSSWDHPIKTLYPNDCTLIFCRFFDFNDNELKPIDFQYVWVEIKDAKNSELNGHMALIEWQYLEFEINTSQQSGPAYPPQGVGSADP